MTRRRTALLRTLIALRASPTPLTTHQLADILYYDREDGGPLCASGAIGAAIFHLRRERGLSIPCIKGFGYRLTEADRKKLQRRRAA